MSMLARYQKKGGFLQLLTLLEGFGDTKRKKFIEMIASENSTWAATLESKMLNVPKILSWSDEVLREVVSRLRPLTIGMAFHGLNETDRAKISSLLPYALSREVLDLYDNKTPSEAEMQTVFMKIIAEVRSMENQGIVRLYEIQPELRVPDNIEELLNATPASQVGFHSLTNEVKNEFKLEVVKSHRSESGDESLIVESDEVNRLKKQLHASQTQVQALSEENQFLKALLEQIRKLSQQSNAGQKNTFRKAG